MRKAGILLGIALVVLVSVALIIVALAPGSFGSLISGLGPEQRQDVNKTFEVNGKGQIVIENDNGKIDVNGVPGTTVVTINAVKIVNGTDATAIDRLTFTAEQQGDNIIIKAGKAQGFENWFIGNARVEISVSLPQTMAANLTSSNGAITLRNFNNSEATNYLKTSNGTIRIEQVKAKVLELHSSNGAQTINNSTASLKASTSNGRIEANNSNLNLERVSTSNGQVDINGTLVQTSAGMIETSNGSIQLNLDKTNAVIFDATTGNGNIDFQLSGVNFEIKDKRHVLTTADGPTLRISAGNGSVTIK
ncbi:MAG: DUF4097 family beta strand repeat protein [Chloroflexi bacterium]|uniref:DUF4097 family beta strand repeat protein n=1 Tax=Candidatus Chlorohelix allophototropha TaxID=3003348 RepID=A0A8T7M660_9CHLR|nr:DUF4097 family beta strand repeat protein [Chloroflexota bacterium]WJW69447.1 DUF4097 family beta strand repeat-containing protein [Chloroflexota bacterium L227-S17]